MSRGTSICLKWRISRISEGADQVPIQSHEQVRMGGKKGYCVACKGLRFGDRPRKRVALGVIASNSGRKSSSYMTRLGCKQCDVFLCKDNSCFEVFYKD
jgi:hypothetical protein